MPYKDHLVTGESFELQPDPVYGFLKTHPQPSDKDLPRYYEHPQYYSHQDTATDLMGKVYSLVKNYNLKIKHNILNNSHPHAQSLLDVGCGTGSFLDYNKSKYPILHGVEPALTARKKAQEKGLHVFEKLEDLPDRHYDIITLWHVLEHFPDPEKSLNILQTKLAPNGLLLIAVPNHRSHDAQYYQEFWAAYDVPRHLSHFDQQSMTTLLKAYQFNVVKILPMVFDAFYVSWLSSQYQQRQFPFLHGILRGVLSNLKALRTQQWSSLIYLVRKMH